jgi:dCMP deaminase
MLGPREAISWDEYFMRIAIVVSQKSRDPHTQVGSVICDKLNRIVSCGYNGPPIGIDPAQIPWDREGPTALDTKYQFIMHSEDNALAFADMCRLKDAKIYTTLFPCSNCCKRIIQAQIREVVYLNDKYHDTDDCAASRKMFDMAGVKYRQYTPEVKEIKIG